MQWRKETEGILCRTEEIHYLRRLQASCRWWPTHTQTHSGTDSAPQRPDSCGPARSPRTYARDTAAAPCGRPPPSRAPHPAHTEDTQTTKEQAADITRARMRLHKARYLNEGLKHSVRQEPKRNLALAREPPKVYGVTHLSGGNVKICNVKVLLQPVSHQHTPSVHEASQFQVGRGGPHSKTGRPQGAGLERRRRRDGR